MTEFSNEPEATDETAEVIEGAEKQPRFDNVRAYRHAATGALSRGREALALRTDKTGEIYHMINGTISEILRGRSGFGVEEQVAHLDDALAKVAEAKETLPAKIAEAKASILEAVEAWEETIMAEVQAAHSVLREGKEYAATRDFEAHQARKHSRGGYHAFGDDAAQAVEDNGSDEESEEDGGW